MSENRWLSWLISLISINLGRYVQYHAHWWAPAAGKCLFKETDLFCGANKVGSKLCSFFSPGRIESLACIRI